MFFGLEPVSVALADSDASKPGNQIKSKSTGNDVAFFTKTTRLWKGRSQIICFQVAEPAVEDRYYSFQLDEKLVHLLIPPRILKGEKIGYLRVQALVEGKTQIGIEGAKLDVDVVTDPALSSLAELNPQIVSPASGASVWGEFSVGVEQLALGDSTLLPVPTLRLPDGKQLMGRVVPDQKPSPHARWVFDVNASELSPGTNKLVAVEKDADGRDVSSNSLMVDVVSPDAGSMLSGLCQDELSGDRTALDGPNPPKVINDDKYGKGMTVDDGNEGESWCLPVWIATKGQYQMLVTARGEIGGDALPTIAMLIDEQLQPETTVRLATTEWQRVPVGHPVTLEAGGHILSVRIRNAFSQGPEDIRSLYLQKYEFVRVDRPEMKLASASGPAGEGATMMTMVAANNEPPAGGGSSMMSMVAANNGGPVGGGSPMMAMVATAHASGQAGDLHVAFLNNPDGQMVTGTVDLTAKCWWPDRDHAPPPQVQLYRRSISFCAGPKHAGIEGSPPFWRVGQKRAADGPGSARFSAVQASVSTHG